MPFLDWIIEELEDASDWFYEAYQEVKDWVWPFYLLEYPMYGLYGVFHWLAQDFVDFNEWVDDAANKIVNILSEWDILNLLRDWLDKATWAWDWISSAWSNVTSIINDWWPTILPYILSYVDIAVEGLDALKVAWDTFWTVTFPGWTSKLDSLKAEWDNFWTVTLPNLLTISWLITWWNAKLLEISTLINDAIKEWFPFYDSLSQLWSSIAEFITDPLQWFYDRLEELFERFW